MKTLSMKHSTTLLTKIPRFALTLLFISVLLLSITHPARAQTERVLYSFTAGKDGSGPDSGLVQDAQGNLYGTTQWGGGYGLGTVFMVNRNGGEKVLYSFTGGADGSEPAAALIFDTQGYLYGTTGFGGAYNCGTVFRLSPSGDLKVLHTFAGGMYGDGNHPVASLIQVAGYLYGTTEAGGTYDKGTVFQVKPTGAGFKILYTFTGGIDGAYPTASLILDAQGNFYSTTWGGGGYGAGTVFQLSPTGTEKVLYSFTGGGDGSNPSGGVIQDSHGDLYGTTARGGACFYCGTVFSLSRARSLDVLHSFVGGADGRESFAGLIQDAQGNLYGTTYGGGYGVGTVFVVNLGGNEKILYNFAGAPDGSGPYVSLVGDALDPKGPLYGTTYNGGAYGRGTVFALLP